MARKLIVEIVGDSKSYERALGRSAKATKGFSSSVSGLGTTVGTFAKRAAVVGGAAAGLAGIIGVKAVSAASDLNEEINKTNVVFGESGAALTKWSTTTANSLGLSQRAALQASGNFGNMFRTIGLGNQDAADMSQRLVTLGADMASFSNEDPTEMLNRLRSGLAGEAEPLRRFGVLLSEARVQEEAVRIGIAKTGDTLTEQQKVQARYSLILKDTAVQQGDFARTSDSLANSQRRVKAGLEDAAAAIGTAVLPVVARAMDAFASFLPTLRSSLGNIGAAIQPVLTAVSGQLLPVITNLVRTVQERAGDLRRIFISVAQPVQQYLVPILRDFANVAVSVWSSVVGVFSQNSERIRVILTNMGIILQNVWAVARPTIVFLFTKVLPVALNISIRVMEKLSGVVKVLAQIFVRTVSIMLKAIDAFLGGLTQLTDAASHLPLVGDHFSGISDKVNAAREGLQGVVTDLDAIDGKSVTATVNIKYKDEGRPLRESGDPSETQDLTPPTLPPTLTPDINANTRNIKTAETAAEKAQKAFDNLMDALSFKLDKARITRTFADDIATLKLIQSRIRERIKEVGKTTELQRALFEATQDLKSAQRDRLKAAQFEALGLTAEGEKPVASSGALLKRAKGLLESIKGTSLNTAKNRQQLKKIVAFLKKNFKSAGRDIRQAILDMLNTISGATSGSDQKGPLTAGRSLNTKKIIDDLGLSDEQARELRLRLSRFSSNFKSGGGGGRSSVPPGAGVLPGMPIVVHTTINLDGQKVATNTTRHQQKGRRRNPPQKRGPNRNFGTRGGGV